MQMETGIADKIEPHIRIRIGSDDALSRDFYCGGSRRIRHLRGGYLDGRTVSALCLQPRGNG